MEEISKMKATPIYPEGVMKIIEQNKNEPVHWLEEVTY